MTSSTRCAWYVQHIQDFPPRAQFIYEKHFRDAKSWLLCCISPAPAPFTMARFHCKWLKRAHEVLKYWNSRIWNQRSHIFKFFYITQLSYKRKLHKSFRDQGGIGCTRTNLHNTNNLGPSGSSWNLYPSNVSAIFGRIVSGNISRNLNQCTLCRLTGTSDPPAWSCDETPQW